MEASELLDLLTGAFVAARAKPPAQVPPAQPPPSPSAIAWHAGRKPEDHERRLRPVALEGRHLPAGHEPGMGNRGVGVGV